MIMHNTHPVDPLPAPSHFDLFPNGETLLFLDIETTGLSPSRSEIYLIGALSWAGEGYTFLQWFAQSPSEEKEILEAFLQYQEGCSVFLHYNGDRFDLPFLKARCEKYGLSFVFPEKPSIDLYKKFAPLKKLCKLPSRRLTALEEFLGFDREGDVSGKECIRLYKEYCRSPKEELAALLLNHNRRDLLRLPPLLSLFSYLDLLEGNYTLLSCSSKPDSVTLALKPLRPLPALFSYGTRDAYLTGEGDLCRVRLCLNEGRLKKYYANWKDYDYLPKEDTAVPKSLGRFLDPSLRKKATKETCYTWFPFSQTLAGDLPQMEAYLKENLAPLLGFFENRRSPAEK